MKKNNSSKTTERTSSITKRDIVILAVITIIYAIISFINLGSFSNPQTFWVTSETNNEAIFRIKNGTTQISKIRYYTGAEVGNYYLYVSYDGQNYAEPITIAQDKVFAWIDFDITGDWQYFNIISEGTGAYFGEIKLYDDKNNPLELIPLNKVARLLVDEQDTVPVGKISYLKTTYFDEIYFPRTAYEHLHNLSPYEWTHPPLGKLIIAIPISILGMTPFAYRLMGNIAGIAMIVTIYIFAKTMFKETNYAALAAIIMAADGMHFVQTRIGTADSFLVLFILLSFLFMYKYIICEKEEILRKKLFLLFWSGLFIGLAIAVKWSGLFAGLGLAVIFSANLIINIFVKKNKWDEQTTIIILSCITFFIIIPLVIYILSYIPLYKLENSYITNGKTFIEWQKSMYDYHANLQATHPYTSTWYTWPIMQKSIWYWAGSYEDGSTSTIALLGNPAIWWFSVPCMLLYIIRAILLRKSEYWFVIVAIVAMLLPYLQINRIMFLYHYFPVLPFVMLIIVDCIKLITEKTKRNAFMYIYIATILVVFSYFYPIYSGKAISKEYKQSTQWLKTWTY